MSRFPLAMPTTIELQKPEIILRQIDLSKDLSTNLKYNCYTAFNHSLSLEFVFSLPLDC